MWVPLFVCYQKIEKKKRESGEQSTDPAKGNAAGTKACREKIVKFLILIVLRKCTAILLLGVLLYNWLGYRLVYDYLQHRADRQLETRLDLEDYDDSRLIEIKVPLNLPYQSNWTSFERYDGELEVNGQHYKYVKRRVYNDSLILLCLPNEDKEKIQDACNNYFKWTNDLQHPSKNSSSQSETFFKSLQTEYRPEQNNWTIAAPAPDTRSYGQQSCLLRSLYRKEAPERPPDAPAV